jgi:hypothetical protein
VELDGDMILGLTGGAKAGLGREKEEKKRLWFTFC